MNPLHEAMVHLRGGTSWYGAEGWAKGLRDAGADFTTSVDVERLYKRAPYTDLSEHPNVLEVIQEEVRHVRAAHPSSSGRRAARPRFFLRSNGRRQGPGVAYGNIIRKPARAAARVPADRDTNGPSRRGRDRRRTHACAARREATAADVGYEHRPRHARRLVALARVAPDLARYQRLAVTETMVPSVAPAAIVVGVAYAVDDAHVLTFDEPRGRADPQPHGGNPRRAEQQRNPPLPRHQAEQRWRADRVAAPAAREAPQDTDLGSSRHSPELHFI